MFRICSCGLARTVQHLAEVMGPTERAVNAFDALLAVAKAASDFRGSAAEDFGGAARLMDEALSTLDAAHPDWREWTP